MCTRAVQFSVLLLFLFLSQFAIAATYPMPAPGNDIVGNVYKVKAQPGDTIGSLGLRYGMSLHEMLEANPGTQEGRLLSGGRTFIVPGQFILPPFRQGIVVNMAELRLYYFTPDGKYVMTFPVAMGRDEWRTPTIQTTVVSKEKDPIWNVPKSIQEYGAANGHFYPDQVMPGPDNPLGHYALHLGAPGYLIHGNNQASSIGKFVSSGCIRMKNTDIETLFSLVKVGTPVYIIHYPTKVGWYNGVLYQQSQIPVELDEAPSNLNQTSVDQAVEMALQGRAANVDWDQVNKVADKHLGIPTAIGEATSAQASQNYETAPPSAVSDSVVTGSNDQNDGGPNADSQNQGILNTEAANNEGSSEDDQKLSVWSQN